MKQDQSIGKLILVNLKCEYLNERIVINVITYLTLCFQKKKNKINFLKWLTLKQEKLKFSKRKVAFVP